MRYFIGIKIDEKSLDEILHIQKEVKKELIKRNVKFTEAKKENIHLTLKFIGEYKDEEKLKEIIKEINSNEITQEIKIDKISNFNGRVVFLNVVQQKPFEEIHREINRKLNSEDERFHAHITLFRIKNPRVFYENRIELKIKLKSICLYNSTLTSQGPRYEILYEKVLKEL